MKLLLGYEKNIGKCNEQVLNAGRRRYRFTVATEDLIDSLALGIEPDTLCKYMMADVNMQLYTYRFYAKE